MFWIRLFLSPVANAINVLQAFIYKSVNTGIFLIPLVATSIVEFKLLILDCLNIKKSKQAPAYWIWQCLWLQVNFKIAQYLQTCKYWPVKRL